MILFNYNFKKWHIGYVGYVLLPQNKYVLCSTDKVVNIISLKSMNSSFHPQSKTIVLINRCIVMPVPI